MEYSIWQHAFTSGRPLIVNNTREHPDLAENAAVTELGVAAHAGIPLITTGRHALGTACVMDTIGRDWTAGQLAFLAHLADIATNELRPTTPSGSSPTATPAAKRPHGAPPATRPQHQPIHLPTRPMGAKRDPAPEKHQKRDLTAEPGSSKEVQPGDHLVDGNQEYQVQIIEKKQGRPLITDTNGLAHTYPAGPS